MSAPSRDPTADEMTLGSRWQFGRRAAARRAAKRMTVRKRSIWRQPLPLIGIILIVAWVLIALAAPWVAPASPIAQDAPRFLPPSAEHPFGTDNLGRDVLSRVLHGARISLPYALFIVFMSSLVGGVLGAIAGYFRGPIESIIMRATDLVFAFPTTILTMAVAGALGPSLINAVSAIVVVSWPVYARVFRGLVLSTREMDYVQATRLLGASSRRAMFVDILPNIAGPVVVLTMLELGQAVLQLATLSFLGLGAQPPAPEWGAMVATGARSFDRWWLATFPGLAILTTVLAFNFLGDGLRDRFDPQSARDVRSA